MTMPKPEMVRKPLWVYQCPGDGCGYYNESKELLRDHWDSMHRLTPQPTKDEGEQKKQMVGNFSVYEDGRIGVSDGKGNTLQDLLWEVFAKRKKVKVTLEVIE